MATVLDHVARRLAVKLELWGFLTALPSLLLGGWLFTVVYTDLTETRQQAADLFARHTLDALDRLVFERYGDTLVFSGLPPVRALDPAQLPVIADHLVTTYTPYYRLAVVVDRQGLIVAANRVDEGGNPIPTVQLLGRSVAAESWFTQAMNTSRPVLIEDFHVDPLVENVYRDQRPVMSFSAAIKNQTGEVIGVWSTRLALAPLEAVLQGVPKEALVSVPFLLRLRTQDGAELISVGEPPMMDQRPLVTVVSTGFSRFPGLGWKLEAFQPPHAVDQRVVLSLLAGWLGLIILGAIVGMGLLIHRRLVHPVLALTAQAQTIARRARTFAPVGRPVVALDHEGKLSPTALTRKDELGTLARTIQEMADEVHEQLSRLTILNATGHSFQQELLSLPALLTRIVHTAKELTGARYAALGIFDKSDERLVQLLTAGVDDATKDAIGTLPTGRGLLGFLAAKQGVLRIKDVTQHPEFTGFPPHHPPMHSFLGVSIRAHGHLFGRLYLTDKQSPSQPSPEFTDADEQIIGALAFQAGTAIETAHLLRQVQEAEARNRAILNSVEEGIYGIDTTGRCLFLNQAGATLLGYAPDDVVGQHIHPLIHHTRHDGKPHPREACSIHSVLDTGEPARSENELFWRRDGTSFPVTATASPLRDGTGTQIGAVVSFTDITERRRLEEHLRQAQKMEAIGRLAGGIAHDFNNVLTAILGYSGFLLDKLDPTAPARRDVQEIKKAGERAAWLTQQLLAFSRKQVLKPQVLDLNQVIEKMDRLLRRLIGEHIRLLTVPAPTLGRVKVDQSQIEQVLMNLAINARDAMPEGGRLTIETAPVDLDEAYAKSHAEVVPGPYVMLAMSDTGSGMEAATKARIFEPFFTTKPIEKGTGLGLATVYGIVKQSGGHIWVYSEPGHGTTFKIYFPRVTEPASPPEQIKPEATARGGSETVLVVEDDSAVRSLARAVLEEKGYRVLEAANGEEALRVSASHQDVIHLLLTDVIMPGMSGRVLAERLSALRPEIKALFISGYAGNAIFHHGVLDPGIAFLQKPFTAQELAQKVREVLDATESPP